MARTGPTVYLVAERPQARGSHVRHIWELASLHVVFGRRRKTISNERIAGTGFTHHRVRDLGPNRDVVVISSAADGVKSRSAPLTSAGLKHVARRIRDSERDAIEEVDRQIEELRRERAELVRFAWLKANMFWVNEARTLATASEKKSFDAFKEFD